MLEAIGMTLFYSPHICAAAFYACRQGNATACKELFCPVYSAAVAPDPLLGNQSDIFLAGGTHLHCQL